MNDAPGMPEDFQSPAPQRAHVVICPQCQARYRPRRDTRGRRIRCRHCGHVWRDISHDLQNLTAALDAASTNWTELGPSLLAETDQASSLAHVVRDASPSRTIPSGEWLGRQLGHYAIKSVLGLGAMGYVYEASDLELGRDVALKILPRRMEAGREPIGLKMFLQEARSAAKIQHPNVVTIYDIGHQGDTYYFTMEKVDGTTLAALVAATGPLPARQACYIIAHAARGLAAGHKLGVVHRDVKPGNIMIDLHGRVKVTDFGLAHLVGIEGFAELRDRPLGTPGWISPEVARAEEATLESDIYSLGLTLYYALTRERLLKADDRGTLVARQRKARSVSRDALPEGWPPRLRDVVAQCLQAAPKDRYHSAELLAADLLRVIAPHERDGTLSLSTPDLTLDRPRRMQRRWWALAGGVLALVLIVVIVWMLIRSL